MTTTYQSAAVLAQLDQAQTELDHHLVSTPSGRCAVCGDVEPCAARDALQRTLTCYGRLPKRRPGLTRAGERSGPGGWLGD
jgi:hypothetical protein